MTALATINRITRVLSRQDGADRAARESYRRFASQYRGRPADYCREVLGQAPTPQQCRIWELAETYPFRVCVPSANNQGKTFSGAAYASYFFDTYPDSVSLLTASTQIQVRDGLFKELRRLRPPFGFMPRDTRLETSPSWYVHGFTAVNPDAFQGRHADNVLVMFDEATALDREFWLRALTMAQPIPGHAFFAYYNPNDPASYAYEAEESGAFHVVRLNALDHPNIHAELLGRDAPIPSAVRLANVAARVKVECRPVRDDEVSPVTDFQFPEPGTPLSPVVAAQYQLAVGRWYRPETPEFEAQVLGRWPIASSDALFSPAGLMLCRGLSLPFPQLPNRWPLAVGCDVARFGDDCTAIAVRYGPVLLWLEKSSKRDTNWIANRIRELTYELARAVIPDRAVADAAAQSAPVYIDSTGGYGGGVADKLADLKVVELNMAAESPDPTKKNMRAYLWFRMSSLAGAQLCDLSRIAEKDYREMVADMIAQRYKLDDKERRVLIPKRLVKEKNGRSPDLGDAVCLAYYG